MQFELSNPTNFLFYLQETIMRPQKRVYSGVAGVTVNAMEMGVGVAASATPKVAPVLTAQPDQGRTSWRGRAQLRMTLFTSRDGWDSSVGWL